LRGRRRARARARRPPRGGAAACVHGGGGGGRAAAAEPREVERRVSCWPSMAGTEGTPGGTPPGSPPAAAAAAAAGTTMGKAIGLFFFKGGVGKTTHTVNISGALASMGYKVLMVDFDPQCNTTQYFNESGSDDTSVDQEAVQAAEAASIAATLANGQLGNAAGALPLIEQDDPTSTLTPQSMEAFVGGMALGDTGNVSAPFNTFYSAHEPWETLITDADGVGIGIKRVNRESFSGGAAGELSIIPGSPALAKYEKALADACANAPSDEGACKGYGLCHRMLDLFRRQYDFIIVDMSPSAGHLNQVMSMACDYLITPCQASLFSAGSMHALFETVLPKWYHHRDKVCEFQSDEISDPRLRPYCLRGNVPILSPILVGNCE
jgi:cellulose biosynthesis protein BcsQ